MLYESGIDPLVSMKIVGHTDYQTTANIYTHIKEEMLKKATVDREGVFKKRAGKECDRAEQHHDKRFAGCLSIVMITRHRQIGGTSSGGVPGMARYTDSTQLFSASFKGPINHRK